MSVNNPLQTGGGMPTWLLVLIVILVGLAILWLLGVQFNAG